MSAKYTFLAWDTPIANATLKLALLQLANNADDNGFSFYSISKMAVSCGMSERTFMRKIVDLEKMGVLEVERRSNRPSLYTLIGDEMGVTLCHLQTPQVTESHGGVTESHSMFQEAQIDRPDGQGQGSRSGTTASDGASSQHGETALDEHGSDVPAGVRIEQMPATTEGDKDDEDVTVTVIS